MLLILCSDDNMTQAKLLPVLSGTDCRKTTNIIRRTIAEGPLSCVLGVSPKYAKTNGGFV